MKNTNDVQVDKRWNGGCFASAPVNRSQRGFTLVELMMVVVILGTLSVVAMMGFRQFTRRARASEAYTMISEVRLREEQYKAEFGQYAAAALHPAAVPPPEGAGWGVVPPADWTAVGARPDGVTHFQYEVLTGAPGEALPGGIPWDPDPPNEFWFVVHAQADLDDDGTPCQFEGYSASKEVWVNPGDGTFEHETM